RVTLQEREIGHLLPPGVERHLVDHAGMALVLDPLETDDLAAPVNPGGDDPVVFRCHDLILLGRLVRHGEPTQAEREGRKSGPASHGLFPSAPPPPHEEPIFRRGSSLSSSDAARKRRSAADLDGQRITAADRDSGFGSTISWDVRYLESRI